MNILFLASAWKVSIIKAFQEIRRSKKLDFGLFTADSDVLSSSLYFSDQFYVVPKFSDKNFCPHLLDLCKKEKITAIVPLTNKAIVALDNLKSDLKSMGITPVLSSTKTIHICLDKWKCFLFCKQQSIPVPHTVLANRVDYDAPMEFPLFSKKRLGEGSNDTGFIKTKEQLQALQLSEEYVIQNYIEGTEYTIDVLCNFKGEPLYIVPRERLAVRGGEILKGKTVHNPEIIQWTAEIASKLNIFGPASFQCICSKQGNYYFTDINLRFASGVPLTFAAGVNYPEMLIKIIRGEKVKKIIGEYEKNLFMLRYDEAVFKKDIT